jgi:putative membrane protein
MVRNIKDYIIILLKGSAMGAADVVPGVSGGTIAFISGIYEELIESIKSVNWASIKELFSNGFKQFWKSINGNFLASLFVGIVISIFSLARLLHFLLDEYPILIWSFFFGLIVASAIYVARQIKNWDYKRILAIVMGTIIAYFITEITPIPEVGSSPYWFVFISGMVAICAMILPGISGSFILLLLGQYKFIISVVNDLKISYLLTFGIGAAIGLISFSNVLSWLLKKYHDITVAFLAGFMIGSLNKVWPWKHTLLSQTNQFAEIIPVEQENVLPNMFFELTGKDPLTLYAVLMAVTGFLVIFLLETTFSRVKEDKEAIKGS